METKLTPNPNSSASFSSEFHRLSENQLGFRRLRNLPKTREGLSSTILSQAGTTVETGDIYDSDEIGYTLQQVHQDERQLPGSNGDPEKPRSRTGSVSSSISTALFLGQLASPRYLQTVFKWVCGWSEATKELVLLDSRGSHHGSPTLYHWLYASHHGDLESISQLIAEDLSSLLQNPQQRSKLFDSFPRDVPPYVADYLASELAKGDVYDTRDSASIEVLARMLSRSFKIFGSPLPKSLTTPFLKSPSLASELHSFVINFSTENKLPRFLVNYLAHHEIGFATEQSEDGANNADEAGKLSNLGPKNTAPWVSMLFHFRIPAGCPREVLARSLTKASISNAYHSLGLTQGTEERASLTPVLHKGRPLAVVGTLALAGIRIRDIRESSRDARWYVDTDLLRKNLETSFPLLALAISRRSPQSTLASPGSVTPIDASPSNPPLALFLSNPSKFIHPESSSPAGLHSATSTPPPPSAPSAQQDVTVYDLLESSIPGVNTGRLLNWQVKSAPTPQQSTQDSLLSQQLTQQITQQQQEPGGIQRLNSSDQERPPLFTDFTSFAEQLLPGLAHTDKLDYTYYILEGRPLKAAELVRQDVVQSVSQTDSSPSSKTTSPASSPPTTFSSLALNLPDKAASQPQYLAQVWKKTVYDTVAKMACDHFRSPNIVASCLFFFDQCEIDSHKLKVDLAVAKRLFTFREASNPKARDQHQKGVITLLYQLLGLKHHTHHHHHHRQSSHANYESSSSDSKKLIFEVESLPQRVKYELEKATASLVNALSPPSASSPSLPLSSSLEAARLWDLVPRFCAIHDLPPSKTFLHHLAASNDPFMFLFFAQSHNYPAGMLLQIIEEQVGQVSIHEHLRGVIEGALTPAVKEEGGRDKLRSNLYSSLGLKEDEVGLATSSPREYITCPNVLSDDLFDIAFACQKMASPGRCLLVLAIQRQRPLLAVLATCYQDVNLTEACCAWLYASCPKQLKYIDFMMQVGQATASGSAVPSSASSQATLSSPPLPSLGSATGGARADRFQVPWKKWSLEDLSFIIMALCQSQTHGTLLEAFRLFDPSNPFVKFLMFQDAFLQFKYASAKEHLVSFVHHLTKAAEESTSSHQRVISPVPDQSKDATTVMSASPVKGRPLSHSSTIVQFGDATWTKQVACDVVSAMLGQCPTPYERRCLVESVVEAGLDDRYIKYLRTLQIVDDSALDVPITSKPQVIIDLLMEKRLFNEARELAKEYSLSLHPLTLREVESHVSEFQESYLWDMEFTRMALWEQCHRIFVNHQCEPLMAGDFFFSTVESMDYAGEECYSERSMLLTFALNWYSGRSAVTSFSPAALLSQPQGPTGLAKGSSSSSPISASSSSLNIAAMATVATGPLKSPEFIEQLENRIWLANISAELGIAGSKKIADSLDFLGAPLSGLKVNTEIQAELSTVGEKGGNALTVNLVSASFAEGAGNNFVVDQELAIKNERELNTLNTAIGRLLNAGMVAQAMTLCAQFKHKSKDLQLVTTGVMLAEGLLTPQEVPKDLVTKLKSEDVEGALGELRDLAQNVKECLERIIACHQAGVVLNLSYKAVVAKDPLEVFQFLLICGRDAYKVAKAYIISNRLVAEKVARILADTFCKALLENQEVDEPRRGLTTPQPTPTAFGSPKPSSSLLLLPSTPSLSSMSELSVDPFWTPAEFIPYANLADSPPVLGQEMMNLVLASKGETRLPSMVEVELMIRAHYCYGLVNHMDGMDKIYKMIHERVPIYVDRGELTLLVRLLTGIQKYREMQYVFDVLVKYDMFELILRKAMDKEGQWELKLALRDYLLKNHPEDTERLNMVYLHFNMFREIGETLSAMAHAHLRAIYSHKDWTFTQITSEQLLSVMQLFNESAESFTKEDCCRAAHKCLVMARLVALQIQTPQIRFIGLSQSELRKLFVTHPSFSDAYVVAEAYDITQVSEWAAPIFQHVVLNGNFGYLERFRRVFPTTSNFYQELVSKFRAEAPQLQRQPHYANFQKILEYCSDKIFVFKLAKELKITDLADRILQSFPGVEELASEV